jgi:hypothetical protein
MKRIFPYYDLEATLRCGDKPWPEWPHVYLANIKGPEDFRSFTKKFGGELFRWRVSKWPMPKRADTSPAASDWVRSPAIDEPTQTTYLLAEDELKQAGELLRSAWQGDVIALEVIAGKSRDDRLLPVVRAGIKADLVITEGGGIEIVAQDLWSFARLAFLRDYALGNTQICNNPDCNRTPYFLQSKKGQKFCEHRCAVLANVRRFRNGESKPKHKVHADQTKKRRGVKR